VDDVFRVDPGELVDPMQRTTAGVSVLRESIHVAQMGIQMDHPDLLLAAISKHLEHRKGSGVVAAEGKRNASTNSYQSVF
jgi:hypothetical protein